MSRRLTRLQIAALPVLLLATAVLGAGPPGKGPEGPKLKLKVVLSDLEPTRDRDLREAELYYASLAAEWERDGWGARADLRGAEGGFRPYYRGSVWLEEGYGFFTTRLGEIRVGKLERSFGLADETFGGTLFSLNGVTRNPDFGAGLVGSHRFQYDRIDYSLLYLGANDHVAWEDDGRGVESDPHAKLRDGLEAKATYVVDNGLTTFRPGVSMASSRIVRGASGPEFRRTDLGVDFTATLGPLAAEVQGLYRSGESAGPANPAGRLGYDGAWAGLLHLRAELPTFLVRYTYSEWRYRGADANERLHQPAVVWTGKKGIEATIEFNARRFRGRAGARAFNAFRFGLAATF